MLLCDSHIHILPGIDNGPSSVNEAVEMLRVLHEAKTTKLIATPHYDPRQEHCTHFLSRRRDAFCKLKKASGNLMNRMHILLSAEVLMCTGMSRIPQLEKLLIPGTRLLPIEMPLNEFSRGSMLEFMNLIQKRNICPLILSTERYFLMYEPRDYQKLTTLSRAVYQFNVRSLLENTNIRYEAVRLFNTQHDIVVGSNAHGLLRRPPMNLETAQKLAVHGGFVFKNLMLNTLLYFREAFS